MPRYYRAGALRCALGSLPPRSVGVMSSYHAFCLWSIWVPSGSHVQVVGRTAGLLKQLPRMIPQVSNGGYEARVKMTLKLDFPIPSMASFTHSPTTR